MKRTVLISTLALLSLAACDNKPAADEPFVPTQTGSGGAPVAQQMPADAMSRLKPINPPQIEQTLQGTVVSIIDIPQFTYIEVSENHQTRWLATGTVVTKKGDIIGFDSGSTLENFKSKALNRTFPSITFVNKVTVLKKK
mgnify:CR=1 FL=1